MLKVKRQKLKSTKIVVLDHHVIRKDLNDFGILHINPRFSSFVPPYFPKYNSTKVSCFTKDQITQLNGSEDDYTGY